MLPYTQAYDCDASLQNQGRDLLGLEKKVHGSILSGKGGPGSHHKTSLSDQGRHLLRIADKNTLRQSVLAYNQGKSRDLLGLEKKAHGSILSGKGGPGSHHKTPLSDQGRHLLRIADKNALRQSVSAYSQGKSRDLLGLEKKAHGSILSGKGGPGSHHKTPLSDQGRHLLRIADKNTLRQSVSAYGQGKSRDLLGLEKKAHGSILSGKGGPGSHHKTPLSDQGRHLLRIADKNALRQSVSAYSQGKSRDLLGLEKKAHGSILPGLEKKVHGSILSGKGGPGGHHKTPLSNQGRHLLKFADKNTLRQSDLAYSQGKSKEE